MAWFFPGPYLTLTLLFFKDKNSSSELDSCVNKIDMNRNQIVIFFSFTKTIFSFSYLNFSKI